MKGRRQLVSRLIFPALFLTAVFGSHPAAAEQTEYVYEKTVTAGQSFAVWDPDIPGTGAVLSQIECLVPHGTDYDLIYADEKDGKPEIQMRLNYTKDKAADSDAACIRKSASANEGMLAAVKVHKGRVKLRIHSTAALPSLVLTSFVSNPIRWEHFKKDHPVRFAVEKGDTDRIPLVMCGTIGTQVKHVTDPATNSYDLYRSPIPARNNSNTFNNA